MNLLLNEFERDLLTEVASIGAGTACRPMSSVVGQAVTVQTPQFNISTIEAVADAMGHPETPQTVVLINITGGDVRGAVVLMLAPEPAHRLMHPVAPGIEASALEEMVNILAGASLGALSRFLGLKFLQSPPGSSTDMVRAIINQVSAELGSTEAEILTLSIGIEVSALGIAGTLYFMFDQTSAAKIIAAGQAKIEAGDGAD